MVTMERHLKAILGATEPNEITHCPCCGAFRPWCVCWANAKAAESGLETCSPQSHGRDGYGFDLRAELA